MTNLIPHLKFNKTKCHKLPKYLITQHGVPVATVEHFGYDYALLMYMRQYHGVSTFKDQNQLLGYTTSVRVNDEFAGYRTEKMGIQIFQLERGQTKKPKRTQKADVSVTVVVS